MPLFSLVILRDLFPIHWTLIYIYAPQLNSARLSRLGPCDSCSIAESKYRCPRCEVTSCSLECVQSHKSRTKCSGTRDKTKYIATNKFTDLDLLSGEPLVHVFLAMSEQKTSGTSFQIIDSSRRSVESLTFARETNPMGKLHTHITVKIENLFQR